MFNSCPETNKLPFALSLMSNEYSNHIHVVIIPILLYHIFHGHRLPESFCVRVPEDMYPVILHSEPNRRQKLSLLINRLEIQMCSTARPVFIAVCLVLSVSAPALLADAGVSGCCRQMAESRRISQQTGRVPAHGGMARSSFQEIAADAGNRDVQVGRCHR